MYGVIFTFLREYVTERHGGEETWQALLKANGHGYKMYFPVKDYPDEEIVGLAKAAAEALDLPLEAVLEDFGSYVGPRLMTFYPMYLEGHGDNTFDVIEHAGANIHDALHKHKPDRKPPQLSGIRKGYDAMDVHYKSHRKLCPVVHGIIRGLGEHFDEKLAINETQCILHGADECIFEVTKQ